MTKITHISQNAAIQNSIFIFFYQNFVLKNDANPTMAKHSEH